MASELTASRALASFAAELQWEALAPEVRHEACRAILNYFGTALAGRNDEAVRITRQTLGPFCADTGCTVIGEAQGADLLHAAMFNAMSANVFDFDDTHFPTIIHPTAPVAAALFALAQVREVSGPALLTAFVAGVEVECRIGNAVSPWHYARGWHISSTCGVFGAAVAAGRLLGLDEQQMLWALGTAASMSGGLVENLGHMAKIVGVGNSAANGLLAAMLAARGLKGPEQPLEGARGFLSVMGQDAEVSCLTAGLGEGWQLLRVAYKPYPCGVVLNPVIEACLALYHEAGVRLAEVEEVRLTGHPLLQQRTDRPWPATGLEAQVSAQHAVATVLTSGRAGLDEFSDRSLRAVAGRLARALSFQNDGSYGVEAAQVFVRLRDGATLSRKVEMARGSLGRPLTDAELEEKLRTLCLWGGSACDPEPLVRAVWSLPEACQAGNVMASAAAAGIAAERNGSNEVFNIRSEL